MAKQLGKDIKKLMLLSKKQSKLTDKRKIKRKRNSERKLKKDRYTVPSQKKSSTKGKAKPFIYKNPPPKGARASKYVRYCLSDRAISLLNDERDKLTKAKHNSTSGKDSKTSKQNAKAKSSSSFPSSSSSLSTYFPAETTTTTITTTTTTITTASEPHQKKLTSNKNGSKGSNQFCPKSGKPLKCSSCRRRNSGNSGSGSEPTDTEAAATDQRESSHWQCRLM